MNPKTILKTVFKTLENEHSKLKEALKEREEGFCKRSEKWTDLEETEKMEDLLSLIEDLRDEIDNFINA